MKLRRPAADFILPVMLAFAEVMGISTRSAAHQASNPMQIARGAQEWADNCGRCHNLRDPKEFSAKDWDLIIGQMRVRANLPGQVARDIDAFLKSSR